MASYSLEGFLQPEEHERFQPLMFRPADPDKAVLYDAVVVLLAFRSRSDQFPVELEAAIDALLAKAAVP